MKKTIADTVATKITKGEVKMRSRFSILSEKIGKDGVILGLGIVLVVLIGFIFYWFNINSDLLVGGYGRYGYLTFFESFPYFLVAAFVLLFLLLIVLFRSFDFSYKKPFFLILFFVLCGVLVLGWFTVKEPATGRFYQQGGRMFRMGMMDSTNAVSGTVSQIYGAKIIVQDDDGKQIEINTSPDTHFPFGEPKVGDQIRCVGTWNNTVFDAAGIRVFDESNSNGGPGMMRGRGGMMNR